MGLVEEEDEARLVAIADLGKRLEELGDKPHEHGRPQARLVLYRGELEARDDAAPVRSGAEQIGDVELRLTEEFVAAARLQRDERAQENAHGLRGETADALELGASGIGVEIREERSQVGEVEERETLLVRVVEDEREALLLGRVRTEHLREQEWAEVRDGRAHRNARPDAAERQVLDGKPGGRELEPELVRALLGGAVRRPGDRHPGHVALHVRREHGDAGCRELLGDDLQRAGLPRPGGAGDEPVPIHGREWQPNSRLGHERPVEQCGPELDRIALRRVRSCDRGPEGRRVGSRPRHGARSYQPWLCIQSRTFPDPRKRKYCH